MSVKRPAEQPIDEKTLDYAPPLPPAAAQVPTNHAERQ